MLSNYVQSTVCCNQAQYAEYNGAFFKIKFLRGILSTIRPPPLTRSRRCRPLSVPVHPRVWVGNCTIHGTASSRQQCDLNLN
jgi:hypothetical protein